MVERVRINPDQIILKNASNGTVFDTNRYYLKTDPSGQLKAGGYDKCPSIYGLAGGISDKNTGWYTSDVITGTYTREQNLYMSTPKYSSSKIVRGSNITLPATADTYLSPEKIAYFNSVNSGLKFRWAGGNVVTGTDGDGNSVTTKMVWIQFTFPATASSSGYWLFEGAPLNTWTKTVAGDYGTSYTANFRDATQYDNGYGVIIQTGLIWAPFCVMSINDPVTLSVAVTA